MLRVVVDVNVLVSAAFGRPGAPFRVWEEWRGGAFELVVSPQLLGELRDVVDRPDLLRRLPSQDEAARFVGELEELGLVVEDPPVGERLVPRDPDEDYLVALARAGRAQAIVTGDADQLDAGLDPPALAPRDFLARLQQLGL